MSDPLGSASHPVTGWHGHRGVLLANPIDIVVPVYNAVDDLRRCVDSVLAHTNGNYRLVLIDDASPDPDVAVYFDELSQRQLASVTLLANETNLGFTLSANRGIRQAGGDVVLLNSDTIVTPGWLDALIRCAASDATIGTATPFSNNAEICSFPLFCVDNPCNDANAIEATRRAIASAAVPTYPDLPTGVGFCLYIRRALIDAIGAFDPVFGLGYGEENDLCMRAAQAGFRNVLCDDAFVSHLGGRSFEDRKTELGPRNMALLLERHPAYLDIVRAYIAADPLRAIRGAALAKLRTMTGPAHGVLHVIHGHGGGTEHHARALIDVSRSRYRHYLVIAVGDNWQLEEHLDGGAVRTFNLTHHPAEGWLEFVGGICAAFRIHLIHLHNISGARDAFLEAIGALGIPYGYTIHDLNFACPTITFLGTNELYCGAQTDPEICGRCLETQPDFAHIDIVPWRQRHGAMLHNAAFLIAPSRWAAGTFARYFPDKTIEVIAHGAPGVWASQDSSRSETDVRATKEPRLAVLLPADDIRTVAVLGAVGPDKGARRVERMVELVRARRLRLRFVLIGYLDVQHTAWQSDDGVFTVHGEYAARDLPDLLAHYRVRLVAYPSAGPETFSFTLSEAWAAGRPVIVPPFGALAERVEGTGAGWIWTLDEWHDEERMLARIVDILAQENAPELALAAEQARARPQPTLAQMAKHTLALYERATATFTDPTPAQMHAPLTPRCLRDALGYHSWTPPPPSIREAAAEPAVALSTAVAQLAADASTAAERVPEPSALTQLSATAPIDIVASPPPARMLTHVSRAALRWRHTLAGRVLYRLTPRSILDALKAHLH